MFSKIKKLSGKFINFLLLLAVISMGSCHHEEDGPEPPKESETEKNPKTPYIDIIYGAYLSSDLFKFVEPELIVTIDGETESFPITMSSCYGTYVDRFEFDKVHLSVSGNKPFFKWWQGKMLGGLNHSGEVVLELHKKEGIDYSEFDGSRIDLVKTIELHLSKIERKTDIVICQNMIIDIDLTRDDPLEERIDKICSSSPKKTFTVKNGVITTEG